MLDIGNGVVLPSSTLELSFSLSTKVTVFARNLMRNLFKKEDLIGRSLFGKMSNANIGKTPLPTIDSKRRDALIGKYIFLITKSRKYEHFQIF